MRLSGCGTGVAVTGQTYASSREGLVAAIIEFIGGQDLLTLDDIKAALAREIDAAGPGALIALKARLSADLGWAYYPPDPLARRIHHVLADRFLAPDSELVAGEHLARIEGARIAIIANHLSYADANLIEVLLQRSGLAAIADRLTAVAGPKVFTDRHRRFSSLCFGTVKVPQSTDVASEEAVSSAREVAAAARRSIEAARARLAGGDALLLFAEGTRSRTAAMQPLLAGVGRYLDVPGTWVLPAGLTGAERLFPVGDSALRPARVVVRFGPAIPAGALLDHARGDRRLVMDAIGLAIAELLPEDYRGVYGDAEEFRDAMHALLSTRQAPGAS